MAWDPPCRRPSAANVHSSLSLSTITTTRSSSSRAIRLRSTGVVVSACHTAGRSAASVADGTASSAAVRRGGPLERRVLLLEPPLLLQRLLPATFQLTAHQAVLRLAGLVLAGGPFRSSPHALAASCQCCGRAARSRSTSATAARLASSAAGWTAASSWLATRSSRACAGEALAQRLGVVGRPARAGVHTCRLRPRVADHHPPAAPPTVQQPGQQCRSLARSARRVRQVAVGRQSLLVGLEALPGDVGRQAVADQHQAFLGAADQPACARPSGLLLRGSVGRWP